LAQDPAFEEEYGNESDFSDEESDFSDEDDDVSSDMDGSEDLDEEGVSWEEMEKNALEEDKRAAMMRQQKNQGNGRREPQKTGRSG
jgi:hypothetical protein